MKTKFIVYNEHRLHLDCLKLLLSQHFNDYEIQTIQNIDDVENVLDDQKSLCILDLSRHNSFDSFGILESILPKAQHADIFVLSKNTNADFIKKLYKKGIKGFININASSEELIAAVNCVLSDEIFICEKVKKIIYQSAFNLEDESAESNNRLSEELTKREIELLKLLCEGLTGKEIANKMYISISTVESHKRSMMMKLNVHNSARLVRFALDNNVLTAS